VLTRLAAVLRNAYWPLPALCVGAAIALATALGSLDRRLDREGVAVAFTGGPGSARELLSTISTSMLTLTALVFSITIVVLQLTSSQFSPRALRTFLRDRQNQLTLGVFLGTFVYALWALREVRGEDGLVDRFVPGITITVAFLLVLVCVGLFVQYIHHISQSIRAVQIIARIAAETRGTIERVHPEGPVEDGHGPVRPPAEARIVPARRPAVVASIAVDDLVAWGKRSGARVHVLPPVGGFVAAGMPLLAVVGGTDDRGDDDRLRAAVGRAEERDARQDVGFGLRQLVDIAERALSPGINDPSTAVQCLDQLHDLLRRLAARPYPPAETADDGGVVRVVTTPQSWDDHVGLAIDEIRLWGADSLQVRRRMDAMVDDLLTVAEGARRRPLLERRPLWDEPLPIGP
jgi:uncharacterized membrane protein